MGFFSGATKTIKRTVALIAGIFLTLAGGNLIYLSFKSEQNPFLSKFAWIVLVVGIGLIAYACMGSKPAQPETPEMPASPKRPEPGEDQQ